MKFLKNAGMILAVVLTAVHFHGSPAAVMLAMLPFCCGTWAAVAVGVVGAGASAYSASQAGNTKTAAPTTTNIYGQVNTPNTGAINSMQGIFGATGAPSFNTATTNASQNYAGALTSAASNPAFSAITNYGLNELNGNYLNSPIVNSYADQAANQFTAAGADQNARTEAQYARAGMGFSTANQQAQQANTASAAAAASRARAGIQMQNYQTERQNQQAAPGIISGAISQPLNYLGGVDSAYYQPYQDQANLTTQLAGGAVGQQPTLVQQGNIGNDLSTGIQGGLSLASLYNGINGPTNAATGLPNEG